MFNQKPPVGSVINRSHPLSQGLVHCMLMNESGGMNALDYAKGSVYGLQGDATLNNDGLYCPGVNGAISITSIKATDNMFSYTLVARVKPKTPATNDRIFDKNRWYLLIGNSNAITSLRTAGSTHATSTSVGGIIPNGVSTNVAAVFDGNTNLISLYKNGKEVSYATQTVGVPAYIGDQGTNIHIGRSNIGGAYWDGEIHYAYVYNRALSAQEIASLHENPYQMIQDNTKFFPKSRLIDPTKNSFRWY